jgi:hypothetical protein
MSTQNINISRQNIEGKCDLKCAYSFKYPQSNITAKNNGVFISLTYDNSSVPPVTFNNQKYTVSSILITCPSIHIFNNNPAAAEIVIEHIPVKGGNQLSVAIPIKTSSESSAASNLITEVIKSVANNAPADGESTNMSISGFTLDSIVPKKPFYNYTYNNIDWVVFGDLEAIPLSSSTLGKLKKIIKPYSIQTPKSGLFYNSKGPNDASNFGDGIYISCKPTGSSKEETTVTYAKNNTNYDLVSNPTFFIILQIIVGCVVFILVFYIFNYLYNYFTSDSIKLPKMSMPTFPFR